MAGNRVEELEAKVRELEATVDGLTDELVETKERLRILEEEVDVDDEILEGRPTTSGSTATNEGADGESASADDVKTAENEGEDSADSEDDIIVA